ncbi:MAG: hypothetical protein COA94_02460 [Rickettsiales bacterium]|nr:MAG: hypothetical protein COA94_02460 [Rickettsiales bacterium]
MSSFYVILSSAYSTKEHPSNALSKFVNIFCHPLDLKENDWKVAVQSVSFDSVFYSNHGVMKICADVALVPYLTNETIITVTVPFQNESLDIKTPTDLYNYLFPFVKQFNRESVKKLDLYIQQNNDVNSSSYQTFSTEDLAKAPYVLMTLEKNQIKIEGVYCYIKMWTVLARWMKLNVIHGYNGEYVVLILNRDSAYITKPASEYDKPKKPELISVKMSEVKHSLSKENNQIISTHPFMDEHNPYGNYYFEVTRKEYHSLTHINIPQLSVELLDENNKQLHLLPGQATHIKLKFKRMNSSTFVLRLGSSDNTSIYPDNNAASFKIQLPTYIDLKHQYEVALLSITHPQKLNYASVADEHNFWIELEYLYEGETIIRKFDASPCLKDVDNKKDNKSFFRSLYKMLNDRITIEHRQKVRFTHVEEDSNTVLASSLDTTTRVSILLAHVLGKHNISHTLYDEIKTSKNRNNMGEGANIILGDSIVYSTGFDLFRLLPHCMLLYASCINPVHYGGHLAQILKFIPLHLVNKTLELQHSYESTHLDYQTVNQNTLNQLQFELRTIDGKLVGFEGSQNTFINLIFRRIIE